MPCTTTQKTIGATIIEISFRKASLRTLSSIANFGVGHAQDDAEHQGGKDLHKERFVERRCRLWRRRRKGFNRHVQSPLESCSKGSNERARFSRELRR